jgi:hypothetical protein
MFFLVGQEEDCLKAKASRDSIYNAIENGEGYLILRNNDKNPAETVWPIVLGEFKKIFGLEYAGKEEMLNIHKSEDCQKYFDSLTYKLRTLPCSEACKIMHTGWMQELLELTDMKLVDAYKFGYPTFTWRLTRPGISEDYRSLHKDVWFRTNLSGNAIFDKTRSEHTQRISAWMSLKTVKDKSGLLIVRNSQKVDSISFKSAMDNGVRKPQIENQDMESIDFEYANTSEGDIALWGQNFLHGGAPNNSIYCRVSLEFTLCTSQQSLFGVYS